MYDLNQMAKVFDAGDVGSVDFSRVGALAAAGGGTLAITGDGSDKWDALW